MCVSLLCLSGRYFNNNLFKAKKADIDIVLYGIDPCGIYLFIVYLTDKAVVHLDSSLILRI